MTLNEAIGKCMVLLDEVENSDLLSNISDYKYKLYPLFDSVQRELALICESINKFLEITTETEEITLPADLYELKSIKNSAGDFVSFKYKTADSVLVGESGTYTLSYNAYPAKITSATADTYELEIAQDAQEAMVYGVLAGLCINDEPELYDTYSDKYHMWINNIVGRRINMPKAAISGGTRI